LAPILCVGLLAAEGVTINNQEFQGNDETKRGAYPRTLFCFRESNQRTALGGGFLATEREEQRKRQEKESGTAQVESTLNQATDQFILMRNEAGEIDGMKKQSKAAGEADKSRLSARLDEILMGHKAVKGGYRHADVDDESMKMIVRYRPNGVEPLFLHNRPGKLRLSIESIIILEIAVAYADMMSTRVPED
jgi:hypothetical protein